MISVGFSRDRSLLSRAIRWVTGDVCSHTFLVVDTSLGVLVIEAAAVGYRAIALDHFSAGNEIVDLVPMQLADERAALRASGAMLGERYEFEGLLGMAFVVAAARWLHRKLRNPLHSGRALFCAEAVVRTLAAGGFVPALAVDAESVTPGDVRRLVLGN